MKLGRFIIVFIVRMGVVKRRNGRRWRIWRPCSLVLPLPLYADQHLYQLSINHNDNDGDSRRSNHKHRHWRSPSTSTNTPLPLNIPCSSSPTQSKATLFPMTRNSRNSSSYAAASARHRDLCHGKDFTRETVWTYQCPLNCDYHHNHSSSRQHRPLASGYRSPRSVRVA